MSGIRGFVILILALALAACGTGQPMSAAVPLETKRIALTFDDVPRDAGAFLDPDERAERLRAGLKNAGVEQAAFFVNPSMFADRPSGLAHLAGYMADGHVIANHSSTHPRLSQVPAAQYIADIDAAQAWLSLLPNHRPWFRYPYLDEGGEDAAKRDALRAALAERGLSNGYVTVDASDWFYEDAARQAVRAGKRIDRDALRDLYVESHLEAAEFYDLLARKTIGRSPAHVLLLHETDLAALFVGDLVEALEARGWEIISADEAYADPIGGYTATYDTPAAQGTLIEQVAWQGGQPAPRWYERNDTRVARAEFDRRVLGTQAPAGPQ